MAKKPAKKTVTKKTATKKVPARKASKAKPKAKAQTKAKQKTKQRPKAKTPARKTTARAKTKSASSSKSIKNLLASARRPPDNPVVPGIVIKALEEDLGNIRVALEDYAAHLRSLDRKRLNGVGIKKQGFIERVFMFAQKNPEFLPHYLTLEQFRQDGEYFLSFRGLVDETDQIRELLWNITKLSSDFWYTDALEYYSPVKEGAKRRVDPAESIYAALEPFFKNRGNRKGGDKPETKKQELRNFKALQSGKRDGKFIEENYSPKLTGGVHKTIDETFKNSKQFKETEEGEIRE